MSDDPATPRRRWFRFSLRSLLIFVAVAGVWLGQKANRAQKQSRAVEAIAKWGGTVHYDYESEGLKQPAYPAWLRYILPPDYLRTATIVELRWSKVTDDGFQVLIGLPDLVSLDLEDAKITDASIQQLNVLTKLKVLILNRTYCTDHGVESLKSLTKLVQLGLSETQISDEGVAIVRSMPNLSMLDISSTQVGDVGLASLQGLDLNSLDISDAVVTEEGFLKLQGLPKLDYLCVSRYLITPGGIGHLQALPKLKTLVFKSDLDDWMKIQAELKQALPGVGVVPQMPGLMLKLPASFKPRSQ